MTSDQGKAELIRIRSFPQKFASEKQKALLHTMAHERGVSLDLPKRLGIERVDLVLKRLRKLPKNKEGR